MPRKMSEEGNFSCPVGSFFADMEKVFGKKSKFFDHMAKSRVEFLKGIRSLIDESIEDLEKKAHTGKAERKRTKIKVE